VKDMIRGGLVSITFRQLSPEAIVSLVVKAGLQGIEWGGDVHVPHGDLDTAREVGNRTRDVGLEIASFGSYYRVGESEASGLEFASVLETALTLEAPLIRVWAGERSPADADDAYREMVMSDTRRIADLAADTDVGIAYEYHGGTLTETVESTVGLLDAVDRGNVLTYWQPTVHATSEQREEGLKAVLPRLANVHVFNWAFADDELKRLPLAEAEDDWIRCLRIVGGTGRTHYALIEFVQEDDPDCFLRDAAVLREWISRFSGFSGRLPHD